MKRSGPLKRYTRIRPKRSTPRTHKFIVRLTGLDLLKLRFDCYERDRWICQECGKRTLYAAPDWHPDKYDMAHIRNKRMYGDTLDNVRTLCHACHMAEHAGKLRG